MSQAATVSVKPWGNSHGIRISREMMQLLGIRPGENLTMEILDHSIILKKAAVRKTLAEYAAEFGGRLGPYEEFDWKKEAGIEKDQKAEGIDKVYSFLDEAKTYYLATVDGDKPRVRPFGTILLYDGKLYIQTGKVKDVSRQISANPFVEICAFMNGTWLRISAELVNDDDRDVKAAMLEKMPQLKAMYSADDDNTQVLYLKDAVATFYSFTAEPKVVRF